MTGQFLRKKRKILWFFKLVVNGNEKKIPLNGRDFFKANPNNPAVADNAETC